MKRIALLAAAVLLVPAAASAQQNTQHEHMQHMQHMQHDAQQQGAMSHQQHEQFLQSIIDKRASLNLTDEQVTKLEAFKAKMAEHHKMMQHDSAMMAKMHADTTMKHSMHQELLSIFTAAQRTQVDSMMKAFMMKCDSAGGMQCKVK